jgi:hypothetical protein
LGGGLDLDLENTANIIMIKTTNIIATTIPIFLVRFGFFESKYPTVVFFPLVPPLPGVPDAPGVPVAAPGVPEAAPGVPVAAPGVPEADGAPGVPGGGASGSRTYKNLEESVVGLSAESYI